MCLSDFDVCFGKAGSDQILDRIPLLEIKDVKMHGGEGNEEDIFAQDDDDDENFIFAITVVEDGYNSGRPTVLSAESEEEAARWAKTILEKRSELQDRIQRALDGTWISRQQRHVRELMQQHLVEGVIAAAIIGAFVMSCLEAQVLPANGSLERSIFDVFEVCVCVCVCV